jgi:hypothetical protein
VATRKVKHAQPKAAAAEQSSTVKHPINFTKEEFDREQAHRRHCFAKFCAQHGGDWPEIFRKKEGMTLRQYKEKLDAHRKRKG